MTRRRNLKSSSVPSREFTRCTLTFTDKQVQEHQKIAERLGAKDLGGLVERGLILAKLMASSLEQGCDVVLVNLKNVQIQETGILGDPKDIVFMTDHMKEHIGYKDDIKATSEWWLPIDPLPC